MQAHPSSGRFEFLLRARYQVIIGIFLAVLLPAFGREAFTGIGLDQNTQYNTVVGSAIALIIGHMSYRRLHLFPGIASGSYIITTFTASFAIVVTAFFFMRLEYSRFHLLTSYLLALAFFIFMQLKFVDKRQITLGIVPVGRVDSVPRLDRVIWHRIDAPGAAVPRLNGVVVDLRANHDDAWDNRITQFALAGVPVYHIKDAIEQLLGRVEIDHLAENNLGSLNPSDVYLKIKSLIDMSVALLLLMLLLPVMIAAAILVRLDSPGPSLFKQQRTGFRAKPFTVYKFRTMRDEPQQIGGGDRARQSAMTKTNDARITRLGAFLRKTRIDELPQLLNVLRGEMSLIGPRPEAVVLTRWYEAEIPFYHYRHIIKPGLTGWAQVNQGHVAEVDQVREKLHYDFYYVKNFSPWLDLLIALRTVQTVLTGQGAR